MENEEIKNEILNLSNRISQLEGEIIKIKKGDFVLPKKESPEKLKAIEYLEKNGLFFSKFPSKASICEHSFVLTGIFTEIDRTNLSDEIEMLGGYVSRSVSKETDYIIVGSDPEPIWKYKNFGTKIIDGFLKKIKLLREKDFLKVVIGEFKKNAESSLFWGRQFVFTGNLESMTRPDAKYAVEKRGGRTSASVTKSTDFLVTDGKIEGDKMAKAREYGTKIITEREFLNMLTKVNPTDGLLANDKNFLSFKF